MVGIFGLGRLALAAAVEVSMQYIIWIGLAGMWVVVMAGRDTMRNVLYGYCLQVGAGDMVKVFGICFASLVKIWSSFYVFFSPFHFQTGTKIISNAVSSCFKQENMLLSRY
ncbi:hypothetical protein RHMOL_Rhmol05G0093300 [Rhododendron molle]|uniref:Uncharacterized protein n=1 Tax=Rhododendron molle TaxID=49168 RepID=A0ACC0NP40_RHOML|nr:hypothetical protein RHMOL_Rhmol05G0093300 [Rhododendron molle]